LQAQGLNAALGAVGLGEHRALGQGYLLDAPEGIALIAGGEFGQPRCAGRCVLRLSTLAAPIYAPSYQNRCRQMTNKTNASVMTAVTINMAKSTGTNTSGLKKGGNNKLGGTIKSARIFEG
jgi:hypothetical protein